MQVMASSRVARLPLGPVIVGSAVGVVLLAGGIFLAWLAFATPVVRSLMPTVIRPSIAQMAFGGAIWAVALVAPPCFAIVGALRLGRIARAVTARPSLRAVARLGSALGDDHVSAANIRLPDGRVIHDLVVGPFGIAVLFELPPPSATRHHGTAWEIRRRDGRWSPYENPVERASRDGERVRSWFNSTERDFVVKVYSAAVTTDPTIPRTPTCAVISPDQIPAWLGSLPPSRGLTEDRRMDVVEHIRALI